MRGREARGGEGGAGALLAVLVLGLCFSLTGAQSETTTTISVDPSKPVEGGDVRLTPAGVPTDTVSCRWYRGADGVGNTILVFLFYPSPTQRPGANYTGHETIDATCALHITNLAGNFSGSYKFLLESSDKTLKGEVEILVSEVLSKPTIPRPPVPYPTENVDSLQLTCNTSAVLADVAWLLNKQPLGNNTRIHLSDQNRTLDIRPVLRSDAGDYQCRVFNLAFNETSDAFHIPVVYGPDPPVIAPNYHAYYEHTDIKLSCAAVCYPPAKYTWIFNDWTYGSGENLIFYDVGLEQSGNYICQAENLMSGNTARFTLDIEVVAGGVYGVSIQGPHSVVEPNAVTLQCSSSGFNVSYYWLKGSEPVRAGGHVSLTNNSEILTLNSTTREDSGVYKCFGNNSFSSNSSLPFELRVSYGPDPVVIEPRQELYLANTSLNLTCSADSDPPATYTWYHNSDPLPVGNDAEYVVPALSVSDAGLYLCNASNAVTGLSNTSSVQVVVLEPVRNVHIASDPSKIVEGALATLTCNADGTEVSFFWFKGDQILESDDRISFSSDNRNVTFNQALRGDSGDYTCFANNSLSSSNGTYSLNVFYGPSDLTISPNTTLYAAGSALNLSCRADSNPPAKYTWRFKDQTHNESNWHIENLTLDGAGNYTCEALNEETTLNQSRFLEVKVLEPVRIVNITSDPSKIVEGTLATLTCNADGTEVSFFWFKEDQILESDDRISFSSDNRNIMFNQTVRGDSGDYTCFANNSLSHDNGTYSLNVFYGPGSVVIEPMQQLYLANTSLNLTCSADSDPPATYTWYLNSDPLPIGNDSQYVVPALSVSDAGLYLCNASNAMTGLFNTSSVQVVILEPVRNVHIASNPSKIVEGTLATLTCNADGTEVSFFWFKGDQILESDDRISFSSDNRNVTFNQALRGDSGDYTCHANNSLSSGNDTFPLNVFYGPDAPIILPSTTFYITGTTLNLSCSSDSNPLANYTWHYGDGEVFEGSRLELLNLTLNHTGFYNCTASNLETGNDVTQAQKVVVVERIVRPVLTPPSFQPLEKDNVTLECNTSSSLSITVSWLKDGKGELPENAVLSGNNRTLTINGFTQKDDGSYTCVANNSLFREESNPSVLSMAYGPNDVKINQPKDVILVLGSMVSLLCSADSNPEAHFRWFRNDSNTSVTAPTYNISSVTWGDAGTYRCQANNTRTNRVGSDTVTATVKIAKPDSNGGLSGGAIAGIVIGCLAAVILLGGLLYYLCTRTSLGRTERHASNGNVPSAPGHNQGATDSKPRMGDEDVQYSTLAFNASHPPQPAPAAGPPSDGATIYSEIRKK